VNRGCTGNCDVDSPQSCQLVIDGQTFLNFSSNDYLGLANHPALKEAVAKAAGKFGAGSGSSRLICGSLAPCHELEELLAEFKGTEAALSFSTGYAAAMGTICALLGRDDVIVIDKLVHACIVDAAKLSGAKLRVFDHNNLDDLDSILRWAAAKSGNTQHTPRTLIVTESVFSMDGDCAPLADIVRLKEKYGAWLMVDEAHATGLYGKNRRGLGEELEVGNSIEIQMGTLGKALGASGGYICGSRTLVDYLVNRARSFIFSTAPIPAAAAAAKAGIQIVQSAEGQKCCHTLWERVRQAAADLKKVSAFFPTGKSSQNLPASARVEGAILPLIIGDETQAVLVANRLRTEGIFVPAIRYPTVSLGTARLRITLSASHSSENVATLVHALEKIVSQKS
jgi:8-amino-7-oxononanoate synthase